MISRPYMTARGIIYLDGKLFMQKLNTNSGVNSFWSTPGGKLDAGEDIMSGLRREIIEETGIEPVIGRLLFIQQFIDHEGKEWLEFFYHIENAIDYSIIELENTTHGAHEVADCGFIDPKNAVVLPAALGELDLAQYLSGNRPVVLMNYL